MYPLSSILLLASLTLFLPYGTTQPYDEILKQNVDHDFISVGFTYIDDSKWFNITTNANQFVKDTILLVTIPQVGGTFPVVVKMKEPTILNGDQTVSFTFKLVQPNDSYCSKEWFVPSYLSPVQVAWMVFEIGSYTVNGFQFIAGKGGITRASWSTSATFTNGNLVAIWFPTGCVSSTDYCVLDIASPADRGGINLLQTNNNVKEAGKTLYLSVRAKIIDKRRGQWVLIPHDVTPALINSTYHTLSEETLGYLVYQNNIQIECLEKMIWETAYDDHVNYVPKTLDYVNTYDYPPGLFGIVGTITSLANTILVSSLWLNTSGTFSINEDQCATEENIHVTFETVYLVVVGEKQDSNSSYRCYVNFNSALVPTSAPTAFPTLTPTFKPTSLPTFLPSANPTFQPSAFPSRQPTFTPSSSPTFTPSQNPTFSPSSLPTLKPSSSPTFTPSSSPTFKPSTSPTFHPSSSPTLNPSTNPTFNPSRSPTFTPSSKPTASPTVGTTASPTNLCSNSFPVEMYKI